jgi:membrane fusion protein (multidrug efflux system)
MIRKTMGWIGLIVLLLMAGCGKKDGPGGAGGGRGGMAVPVVTARATRQVVEETIEATGTLTASEKVEIQSKADGVIEAILFQEGERVRAGQTLVKLDQAKRRADLTEAAAHLKMADATRQRYATLLSTGAVARQEADAAEADWAAHQARVERLTSELDDAMIRAPFAGITGARLLSLGQFIPKGTGITTLMDPDPMKVAFHVPERFLAQLTLQQAVKLKTAAHPQAAWVGEVYFIDPQVDAATRTVLLKATVPNPAGRLRPGMFAQVALVLQTRAQALVIPEIALLHQGKTTFVYAIGPEIGTEQKAEMRPVKVGLRMPDSLEILEGLREGESVVVEGHQKLHPGAKVIPRVSAPPAADAPEG